jgi:hypothetical protein
VIAVSFWDAPVTFRGRSSSGPFGPGARLADVRDALDDAGIACALDESRTDDDGAVLVAGRCVEITFHEDRLDEMIASGL